MHTTLQQHPGWKCRRCGTVTTRGNWRREGDDAIFYCQPCVMALGGPAYDPTIPTPFAVSQALVKMRRQARRRARFPRWIRKQQ